ncbi:MAG: TonB family protein [Bacteroidia bacterium]|nr:TonB family protein [Bacteroidia bacterium]
MKRTLILAASLLLAAAAAAQLPEPDINQFVYADREPQPLNLDEVRKLIGYPETAVRLSLEGKVVVRILVNEQGEYVRHKLVTEAAAPLTLAVEEHISKLRFKPAVADDRAIPFWINIPFSFKLVSEEEAALRNEIKLLSDSIQAAPSDYVLRHKRGLMYFRMNMPDEALADFSESLRLNPRKNKKKDPKPYQYLAYASYSRAAVQAGKQAHEAAIADYTAVLEIAAEMKAPDSSVQATVPLALLNRAFAYAMDSAWDAARADLRKVVDSYPDQRCEAYDLLAEVALIKEDPAELAWIYEGLVACRPEEYLLRYSLGYYRSETGKYPEAIREFDVIAEKSNNQTLQLAALNRAAWCYLQQNQLDQAQEKVNQTLKINALNALAYYYEGQILSQRGQQQDACTRIRRALTFGLEGEERTAAIEQMKAACGGWEED